jgi:putative DNA methylase
LIETDGFPFDFLSQLAERESWRKEIYRPIYHVHKWWATRLGSIFRSILLGSLLPADADLEDVFFQNHSFAGVTVFDPFMGSGTTIGEAHKLGCTVLGRDINPVAAEAVRVVMGPLDPHLIHEEFRRLEATAGKRIRQLYKAVDQNGRPCDVLYYFWVKQVACLRCAKPVDLLRSHIIGRNAFPDRKPEIRILCPTCGNIFTGAIHDATVACGSCGCRFDPKKANAHGAKATCSACGHCFTIIDAVRKASGPPQHRLIGKLVLKANGEKRYLPSTKTDGEAYARCEQQLAMELAEGKLVLPSLQLQDGHNTKQALNYGYRSWRDFFNDRQLLALAWLHEAIANISDASTRDAFLTLFSSTLEFNNLFASYKGEGTGAVRHMFSHHILKPERMPIEANLWGTPKSSGAFSGLYRTRLMKAIAYRLAPVEVPRPRHRSGRPGTRGAVQCSEPFTGEVQTSWPPVGPLPPRSIYLSCGSSDDTGLPAQSIDLIATDPPFFDNVHYSELADFFVAWQSLRPRGFLKGYVTTRCAKEVQDKRADVFALKLGAVFAECHRVLKDEGLLVFTYHHSRAEGWSSLASAVCSAGFSFVNAHPIKAEMSVATPKAQAKEPIQLDVILVCRKRAFDRRSRALGATASARAFDKGVEKAARLRSRGFDLSRNDRRVILYSQFLTEVGPVSTAEDLAQILHEQ